MFRLCEVKDRLEQLKNTGVALVTGPGPDHSQVEALVLRERRSLFITGIIIVSYLIFYSPAFGLFFVRRIKVFS